MVCSSSLKGATCRPMLGCSKVQSLAPGWVASGRQMKEPGEEEDKFICSGAQLSQPAASITDILLMYSGRGSSVSTCRYHVFSLSPISVIWRKRNTFVFYNYIIFHLSSNFMHFKLVWRPIPTNRPTMHYNNHVKLCWSALSNTSSDSISESNL